VNFASRTGPDPMAAPTMDVDTAARTLVRAVKTLALQDVKTTTVGRVVRDGLEAMARGFQRLAVARTVARAATTELALLPGELQIVKAACVHFLKN
jgi:hypothetical protein